MSVVKQKSSLLPVGILFITPRTVRFELNRLGLVRLLHMNSCEYHPRRRPRRATSPDRSSPEVQQDPTANDAMYSSGRGDHELFVLNLCGKVVFVSVGDRKVCRRVWLTGANAMTRAAERVKAESHRSVLKSPSGGGLTE